MLVAAELLAQPEHHEYWNGYGGGGPWWGIAWFALLIVVATGVIVVASYRARRRGAPATASARSILADRFARGEIDEEEFAKRMTTLKSSR